MELVLSNPDATTDLGHFLGALLFPGAVVALVGPLGAGKTFLTRAIATGLDVPDSSVVTSPTFTLVHEYEGGRLPVFHFDVYRLQRESDFADLGVEEYFESNGVCLIEWADRVSDTLPAEYLSIELIVTGACSRVARIAATGSRHADLAAALWASWSPKNRRKR